MPKVKKAIKKIVVRARRAGKTLAIKAAAAVRQFTAWSYSRYKDHRDCPRYAHWKHILKKPEGPKSPAMQRGGDIHKEGELYLLGKIKTVPKSFALFKKEMEALRKAKAIPEGKWALTVNWTVTDFFNWAAAWCRVVLDAHYMPTRVKARVIDFKTGKVYIDDNLEQMDLYAPAAFLHYPTAEEVDVELWYLDQPRGDGKISGGVSNPLVKTYRRAQLPALQKKWRAKVIPILTDKRFVPNPGRKCHWCDYSRAKGGECEY